MFHKKRFIYFWNHADKQFTHSGTNHTVINTFDSEWAHNTTKTTLHDFKIKMQYQYLNRQIVVLLVCK